MCHLSGWADGGGIRFPLLCQPPTAQPDNIWRSRMGGATRLAIDTCAMMGLLFGGALCQRFHKCSYRKKSTERVRLAHSVAFPIPYRLLCIAFPWDYQRLTALLPVSFFCDSVPLWVFHRFIHSFPAWLQCSSLPMLGISMVLFCGFSRLEGKVPSAHTWRMRWLGSPSQGELDRLQFEVQQEIKKGTICKP